jgi:hypothetical protein
VIVALVVLIAVMRPYHGEMSHVEEVSAYSV